MQRSFLFLIFLNYLLLIILFFQNQALAYDIETHAYLTKEIIDFYNQNFSNKIPPNLENILL